MYQLPPEFVWQLDSINRASRQDIRRMLCGIAN
jgi:hypothetical protein